MKKLFTLLLTLSLVFTAAAGHAVSYTLPEKMGKQLQIGSGLKGSFTLDISGTAEAAAVLQPFDHAEFQVRGMISDKDWHYYLYQTDENENQWARTDLYHHDGSLYLKSELLPDNGILMLPSVEKTLDILTSQDGGAPSFASAAWNILQMSDGMKEEVWLPLVQQLEDRMEAWLIPFASEPALRQNEDGQPCMELSYVIPMDALKTCILDGLELIAQNQELMTLAADIMDEEQREVYLNPYLRYFYSDALDQLNLTFDATMNRIVSMKGETVSTTIELPLDEPRTGYSSLVLSSAGGTQSIMLERNDRSLKLILPSGSLKEDGKISVYLIDTRSDGKESTARKITVTRQEKTWEDEETRSHASYHYTMDIAHDTTQIEAEHAETEYAAISDIRGEAELHFYSKYAQSSPTTLEVDAVWHQDDLALNMHGKFKSASPWVFSPFEITNPQNILEKKPEELSMLFAEWLKHAGEQIRTVSGEEASN